MQEILLDTSCPSVAIVGRTNVGKSTLFNKLTKSNSSLCANLSGTTRDYIIKKSKNINCQFIDTAGTDDMLFFKNEIKEQVISVMQSAKLIIFVIDYIEGITSEDIKYYELIKKTKPKKDKVIFVVNKAENLKTTNNSYEYHSFGLSHPVFISAEHSIGIDLLENKIKDILDNYKDNIENREIESEKGDNKIKIKTAVIGRPNAGKSSIINQLLGFKRLIVSDMPGTTRESVSQSIQYKNHIIEFIDTAGIRKTGLQKIERIERISISNALKTIEKADVIIIAVDSSQSIVSMQDLRLAKHAVQNYKPIILLANKWDLVDDKEQVKKHFLYNAKNLMCNAKMLTVSAKNKPETELIKNTILSVYQNSKTFIEKSEINNWLQNIKNVPVYRVNKSMIKSKYIVQYSNSPISFKIYQNISSQTPEGYKRYIENQLRDSYKLYGVPIKLNFIKSDNPFLT